LLKVDKNIYQVIDINETTEELYQYVIQNPSVLPQEAFYPTAFENEFTFNEDMVNQDALPSIKRYVQKHSNNERIFLLKSIFNIDSELSIEKATLGTFFDTNLVENFPTTMHHFIAKNKNTELYDKILKYITVSDIVSLSTTNENIINYIKNSNNPIFRDFVRYSRMTNNNVNELLVDEVLPTANDYYNNINLAKEPSKVSIINESTVQSPSTEPFIQFNDSLYQNVGDNTYKKVPHNTENVKVNYKAQLEAQNTTLPSIDVNQINLNLDESVQEAVC